MHFIFTFYISVSLVVSASVQSTATPCEEAIGITGEGEGPYNRQIASQFPFVNGVPAVIPGTRGNLYCVCENSLWAVCQINVRPGLQEEVVRRKLNPFDPENLRPFFIYAGHDEDIVCFADRSCPPVVYAEITIHVYSSQGVAPLMGALTLSSEQAGPSTSSALPAAAGSSGSSQAGPSSQSGPSSRSTNRFLRFVNSFRRPTTASSSSTSSASSSGIAIAPTQTAPTDRNRPLPSPKSSPASSERSSDFFPDLKYISLRQCTDGSDETNCPITLECFEINDIVFVLKKDAEKAASGEHVVCISSTGINMLANTPDSRAHGGFKEPLNRIPDKRLNMRDDYDPYAIIGDSCVKPPVSEPQNDSARSSSSDGSYETEPQNDSARSSSSDGSHEKEVRTAKFQRQTMIIFFVFIFCIFYSLIHCTSVKDTNVYLEFQDL